MPIRYFSLILAVAILPTLANSAEASVTLNSVGITAYGGNTTDTPTPAIDQFTGLSAIAEILSVEFVDLATPSSYAASNNEISFSTTGSTTVYSVDIEQLAAIFALADYDSIVSRTSSLRDSVNPSDGIIFTLDTNTDYTIAGQYITDLSIGDLNGGFGARLVEFDPDTGLEVGTELFSDDHSLGVAGIYDLTGAGITGTLLADKSYYWSFYAELSFERSKLDSVATGRGFVSLTLSESTDPGTPGVVPEATSFLTWGLLALTGLSSASSRRRRS